jgi:lysophosphatidate acyltransferase
MVQSIIGRSREDTELVAFLLATLFPTFPTDYSGLGCFLTVGSRRPDTLVDKVAATPFTLLTSSARQLVTGIRVALASLVLTLGAIPLVLACVLLLPWRLPRLRAAQVFSHCVAPPILWLLGVTYPKEAREEVRRRGPAIFVINHSSTLDTFLSMAMWPPRGCCVGKREVLAIPVFGLCFVAVGMLLIDRKNSASAVAALQALSAEVKEAGLSIWIAPEGTRSRDGEISTFKRGFVHMAIATGLPVVPVVFHGAFERFPVDTWRLSGGHVDIELLDSFETAEWTSEGVAGHAAAVEGAFRVALSARSASNS